MNRDIFEKLNVDLIINFGLADSSGFFIKGKLNPNWNKEMFEVPTADL